MKTRVLTGLLIIGVMTAVLCVSSTFIYPIVLSVIAVMASFEVLRVLSLHKNIYVAALSYAVSGAMPVLAYVLGQIFGKAESYLIVALALVFFVYMLLLFGAAVFSKGKVTFSSISSALVMVVYITAAFFAMTILRYIDRIGLFCLGLVLIGAWISDVFAYFTGVLFGKHKLIPEVSPKKTVEGSVGAVVCTTFGMMLYGLLVSLFTDLTPNYLILAVSGAVLSVAGQIGDLIASVFKREWGVKDYGTLLPGHGGIMDRFDSILATSAVSMIISLLFAPFS